MSKNSKLKFDAIDWTRPVKDLSGELGIAKSYVYAIRKKLGIAVKKLPFKDWSKPKDTYWKKRDWSGVDFSRPVKELMSELGITSTYIYTLRRRFGVAKKRSSPKDWSLVDWSETGLEIATELGVTPQAVSLQKQKYFACKKSIRRGVKTIIWNDVDWTKSNQQIASETGAAYNTVAKNRVKLGKSGMATTRATRKDLEQHIARLKSPVMRNTAKLAQPLATAAAKVSQKSGKGIDNVHAKDWVLLSPDGITYQCHNLYDFVRSNPHLFSAIDVEWKRTGGKRGTGGEYCNVTAGFLNIRGGKAKSWKGWKLL